MFEKTEEKKQDEVEAKDGLVSVKPLRDFVIHMNEHHYELKKGEETKVPKMFLTNLKTEKVIK